MKILIITVDTICYLMWISFIYVIDFREVHKARHETTNISSIILLIYIIPLVASVGWLTCRASKSQAVGEFSKNYIIDEYGNRNPVTFGFMVIFIIAIFFVVKFFVKKIMWG
jgi:hypothetical protein